MADLEEANGFIIHNAIDEYEVTHRTGHLKGHHLAETVCGLWLQTKPLNGMWIEPSATFWKGEVTCLLCIAGAV